jgi:phage shock protein PspC (stress-responsive transcriptional regulator)
MLATAQPSTETETVMSRKVLRRSRHDRMLAGVIGGLARYFGLDPTLLRIIFVLVSLFSAAFPGIIVYLILLVLMPLEEEGDGAA